MTGALLVLLERKLATAADSWTEYLCLERLDAGEIELSTRAYEVLAYEGELGSDVIWPIDHDAENEDNPLPLSIDGKRVRGRDGDAYVGCDLVPTSDTACCRFQAGDFGAIELGLDQTNWRRVTGFDTAWTGITQPASPR